MYRVDARSPPSPVCIFSLVLPACCVVAVVLALTAVSPPPLLLGKARRQFNPNVGPRKWAEAEVAGSERQHMLIRSRTIPPPLHQYPTDYHTSRSIVIWDLMFSCSMCRKLFMCGDRVGQWGIRSFQKNVPFFAFFSILYKRTFRLFRSFGFHKLPKTWEKNGK